MMAASITELEAANAKQDGAYDQQAKQLALHEKARKEAEGKVEAKESELVTLMAQCKKSEQLIQQCGEKDIEMKEQLQDLQTKLKEAGYVKQAVEDRHTEQLTKLRSEIDCMTETTAKLKADIQVLGELIQQTETLLAEKQLECNELTRQLEELNAKKTVAENNLKSSQELQKEQETRIAGLEAELRHCREALEAAELNCEAYKKKFEKERQKRRAVQSASQSDRQKQLDELDADLARNEANYEADLARNEATKEVLLRRRVDLQERADASKLLSPSPKDPCGSPGVLGPSPMSMSPEDTKVNAAAHLCC